MTVLHGNAMVGQSGGPTAAINATLSGVIRGVLEARKDIPTLYGLRNGVEGLLKETLVDLTALCAEEETLLTLEDTPAAALGSCRYKLPNPSKDPETFERILAIFKKYDVRYFFYIGGNDSMDAVAKLTAYLETVDYEMRVIGVPKTIDNDLIGTDHTPGFGSAAKYIATTIKEIIRDCAVYTIPAVTIVEIMGRDAGWLTAASSLASLTGEGPDLIYLPERDFSEESFLASVKERLSVHPNVVVAVSEGIRFADGTYVGAAAQSGAKDTFGHAYLAGTGKYLEGVVKRTLGCKVRAVELNLPQRCAAHLSSATDIEESVRTGRTAVSFARAGVSGHMMVALRKDAPYTIEISSSPVSEIANMVKKVPDAYINEAGNGVTDAALAYLAPLILGERAPVYECGMPRHFVIQ
ncbi:MAG: 6-phosphofructokinase [Clostridia bacterium]|nr:6-phosphofructokinase [Clostridia bacterium]